VPFVFLTGYRGEAIDGRFASCRVLQKPIQRQMLQNAFVVGSRGNASGLVASIPTPLGGRDG
jgi:hypothetical protein